MQGGWLSPASCTCRCYVDLCALHTAKHACNNTARLPAARLVVCCYMKSALAILSTALLDAGGQALSNQVKQSNVPYLVSKQHMQAAILANLPGMLHSYLVVDMTPPLALAVLQFCLCCKQLHCANLSTFRTVSAACSATSSYFDHGSTRRSLDMKSKLISPHSLQTYLRCMRVIF